jgi:hypothetical protein
MSDSHETEAAQARFAAFVEGTEPNERDWIASWNLRRPPTMRPTRHA